MIKIKRIYDPPSPADGRRVLVDRLWPRGISKEHARLDQWLREIAPSSELRTRFGHEPAKWAEFKGRYQQELKAQAAVLDRLRSGAKRGTVTLLFSARDRERNNAVVLRDMVGARTLPTSTTSCRPPSGRRS